MGRDNLLNIHSVIPLSRVNGPGKRLVVFFQGCARRCPGCFNPATHPFKPVHLYSPQGLYKEFLLPDIEGITVSGGEPFSQTGGLLHLLRLCKESLGLTTVVYTGFLYEELKKGSLSGSTLKYIDVLIIASISRMILSCRQRLRLLSGKTGLLKKQDLAKQTLI